MCHTPIVIRATWALFQQFNDEIYPWNRGKHVRLMPIGVSARPMAAFSGFYESHEHSPSGDARGKVPAHCDGHQNGQQSGHILHLCLVCCHSGGCRGNTEQVVAWWRCPVSSGVALDMLHREMPHVSLQRLTMAIEMARNGGAFVRRCRLFCLA